MKKTVSIVWFLFFFISLFSCSKDNDFLEEYIIEIERPTNDSITPKDSTTAPKDTIITPKDTIISPKDTTSSRKDTVICSYKKYMTISPSYGIGQGGACYDKYFFQGYSNNKAIGVYDLDKKKCLGKIDITEPTPNSNIHANTINFGAQRYNKNDFFPLLYINSGYKQKVNNVICSFIYVYRILSPIDSGGSGTFSATLVQTITLKGFDHWTEGVIDNDHNVLWVKYEANGAKGAYRYASFELPLCDKENVDVLLKDHLEDFSTEAQPFTSSNQGHLYYKDKLLLVSGTSPTTQKLAFIVIDLKKKKRDLVIDLADIGLRSEPENVFFYKNQLMIGYRSSIYEFNVSYLKE